MKKTLEDINLNTWFMERELELVPSHFIKVSTPITPESKEWILEKLCGRFGLVGSLCFDRKLPAFEDPSEASFYELKFG